MTAGTAISATSHRLRELPCLRFPVRQTLPDLPRRIRHDMPQARTEDQPPQRLRQIDVVARRTRHARFRRHQIPGGPARTAPLPAAHVSTLRRPPSRSLPSWSPVRTGQPHAKALPAPRRRPRRQSAHRPRCPVPRPAPPARAHRPDRDPANRRWSTASRDRTAVPARAAARRGPCAAPACRPR